MTAGDVHVFDRFARPYAWLMPAADPAPLRAGLAAARRPVERVVDVAGGPGRAVVAVDAPERLVVDAAGGMLRRVPPGVAAVGGDAARLPLRGGSADAVLIVDALHHLPRVDDALAEAARVLRPGGVLVVREFDRGTIRGRVLEVAEHLVGFESRFLTADGLADRIAGAGLEARVTDRGFATTVVGVKPGEP